MAEFEIEIIKVEDQQNRFIVEYEISDTRERHKHGFPKFNGWEEDDMEGNPKVLNKLREIEMRRREGEKDKTRSEELKKKIEGAKMKVSYSNKEEKKEDKEE